MREIYLVICVAALALLASCKSAKVASVEARDSLRVEVRTETILVRDTAWVEIPAQTAERTTRDSTSRLENDYAVSLARVFADGTLLHTLATKPQKLASEYERPVVVRDSIVYRDKLSREVHVQEVERELTRWQRFRLNAFWWLAGVILAASAWKWREAITKLIKIMVT